MQDRKKKFPYRWILFISHAYFKSGRKKRLHFAGLSIVGISAGIMAVIVIIGIMNGLQEGYLSDIVEVQSYHVRIQPDSIESANALIGEIANSGYASAVYQFMELQAVVQSSHSRTLPCLVKGIQPAVLDVDEGLQREMNYSKGEFDLSDDSMLVIGRTMSLNIGAVNGSTVTFMAIGEGRTVNFVPAQKELQVGGIFRTGYKEIDENLVFVHIDLLKKLLPRTIPQIAVKLEGLGSQDLDSFMKYAASLGGITDIQTWKTLNKSLYSALMLEKYSMYIILFLIFIVLAINIKNSIERLIFLQRRDIGLLSAVGAGTRALSLVFVLQGAFVGISGVGLGIITGVAVSKNVNAILRGTGWLLENLFSVKSIFFQYTFPVSLVGAEIFWLSAAVIILCIVSAFIAVKGISDIEPVRILHHE